MSLTTRMSTVIALVALVVAVAPVSAATPAAETTIGNETCCFTNPRYSGICEVTTGPDESCSDVLSYLNNQASVGKSYCGNTQIRGGWAQVECEDASTKCTPVRSPETAQAP